METPISIPRCCDHEKRIDRLEHIIDGNGEPGMRADLRETRRDVSLVLSAGKWILGTLIVSVLATLSNLVLLFVSKLG